MAGNVTKRALMCCREMRVNRIAPKKGQESVWDYPRPPKLETFNGSIKIIFNSEIIYENNTAFRILETSHPPTYYLPVEQFKSGVLIPIPGSSYCEFKGKANYYDIKVNDKTAHKAAWYYPKPNPVYAPIANFVSVYAHMMDACYVNDELVQAQEGDFYGGWITSNIVGPFKGGAGTWGW